ncbi:MAG: hypothetical protein FWH02_05890 [Oscillospiraceae bacterium]|nr:hypothetical protein [Oscillospiraceae bacterium]
MLFMKKPRLLAAAAFFALAVCALFALLSLSSDARGTPRIAQIPTEEGAAADLTGFDFNTSIAYVRFRQAGEYYHNKLLAPDAIDAHSPDDKSLAPYARDRTHRVRFIVPDGNYMIFGKSPEYASRIYVNGELAASFGEIYENAEDNRYQIATYEIAAHPIDGVIEVVTNGADAIRRDANIYSIHIGRHDAVLHLHISVWVKNLIVLGFVFTCALIFIGFYIFTPRSRANLFCALIALSLGIRMVAADKIVSKIFGEFDYRVTYFVENGMLLLIVIFYTLLVRTLFRESIPKLLVRIVTAVNVLMMAALIFLPIHVTAKFIWVHTAMISAVALVSAVCIIRHIRRFREEQILSFCGQVLFILIGLVELLYIQGVDVIPRGFLPSLTVIETTRVATL